MNRDFIAMISDTPQTTIDLKSLTPREIDRFCSDTLGRKPGQGTRVAVWLYRKKTEAFDSMEDLNKPFREQLKRYSTISRLSVEQHRTSEDGTEKLLYRLEDGNAVEGVLIPGTGAAYALCFLTGGLRIGLPFLPYRIGRLLEKYECRGDREPNFRSAKGSGRQNDLKYRPDGHRRTAVQLRTNQNLR